MNGENEIKLRNEEINIGKRNIDI